MEMGQKAITNDPPPGLTMTLMDFVVGVCIIWQMPGHRGIGVLIARIYRLYDQEMLWQHLRLRALGNLLYFTCWLLCQITLNHTSAGGCGIKLYNVSKFVQAKESAR